MTARLAGTVCEAERDPQAASAERASEVRDGYRTLRISGPPGIQRRTQTAPKQVVLADRSPARMPIPHPHIPYKQEVACSSQAPPMTEEPRHDGDCGTSDAALMGLSGAARNRCGRGLAAFAFQSTGKVIAAGASGSDSGDSRPGPLLRRYLMR